jgi:hypothetical protein
MDHSPLPNGADPAPGATARGLAGLGGDGAAGGDAADAGRPAATLPDADPPAAATPATDGPAAPVAATGRAVALAELQVAARALIEGTTETQAAIALRLGIAPSTLSLWKNSLGWTRPADAPDAPAFALGRPGRPTARAARRAAFRQTRMIARLYRAFERQVADIETRLALPGARTDEKDARALGTLARTLETLIALDRDAGAQRDEPEPKDSDQLRAELARRIRSWAEEGEES